MRLDAEQVWPPFWIPALTKNGSARSRSASSNTSCGDFPPSSSVTGMTFFAAAAWIISPVLTDPVNDICEIPLCEDKATPASSPSPVTTFKAPAGRPASVAIWLNAIAVRQASSAGFKTQALPIASAAPTDRPIICIG